MERVIARASNGATLLSVVVIEGDELRQVYRLVRLPDDEDIEFDTLGKVVTYATVHGLQLSIAE